MFIASLLKNPVAGTALAGFAICCVTGASIVGDIVAGKQNPHYVRWFRDCEFVNDVRSGPSVQCPTWQTPISDVHLSGVEKFRIGEGIPCEFNVNRSPLFGIAIDVQPGSRACGTGVDSTWIN